MRYRSSRPGRAYSVFPLALSRDTSMDSDARFLVMLMMGYPDDWEFHVGHLQHVCGWGRDRLRKAMRVAEASGYLIREPIRNASGQMEGQHWILVDDPEAVAEDNRRAQAAAASVSEAPAESEREAVGSTSDSASHRAPENPSLGEGHRAPEKPSVGKPVPIRINKDTYKPLYPLPSDSADSVTEAAPESPKRTRSAKAAPVADSGIVDEEALARLWAPKVVGGKAYLCSAIRATTARTMLRLGLVNEDQLRAVGVAH